MKFQAALDGIDHVNIFSRSKVELGRALSNFAHAPFSLQGYGEFASIEGLWYWLGCHDDRLRSAHGFEAKRLGREIMNSDAPKFQLGEIEFRNVICIALVEKIKANPRIGELLDQSELPLAHYYVFNGKEVDAGFAWLVEAWELIRYSRRQMRK